MPDNTILEVSNLSKHFPVRRSLGQIVSGRKSVVRAVDGVSFAVRRQEILGLVGESGCGKTTTGKLVMKLLEPTAGGIRFDGREATNAVGEELAHYRRQVQMIFQDPYSSMNPRFKIRDVLEEPLLIHGLGASRSEREELIRQALAEVKLTPVEDFMGRFPHMLSGGQRQRAATARTLILSPALLVADEPVSMIDLSTRAEILAMMKEVQRKLGLSFLYITHDLSTAYQICDEMCVLYLGRLVEKGPVRDVVEKAGHPYVRQLIGSIPVPDPDVKWGSELALPDERKVKEQGQGGCCFYARCPRAMERCRSAQPPFSDVSSERHRAACFLYG